MDSEASPFMGAGCQEKPSALACVSCFEFPTKQILFPLGW